MLEVRNPLVWLTLATCLGARPACLADSWTCHQGKLTRNVTVFYPEEPARLPCEVFYSKPTENVMPRATWNSQHEAGYCERKAAAFVDKLRSLGWQCSTDPQTPAE